MKPLWGYPSITTLKYALNESFGAGTVGGVSLAWLHCLEQSAKIVTGNMQQEGDGGWSGSGVRVKLLKEKEE